MSDQKIKILFVDDEPGIVNGIKRMIRQLKNTWEIDYVLSGKEAIEFININSVDVVVSDLRMPQMDGAELLEYFLKYHPKTIRIILSGQADDSLTLKTLKTAHQFLSKPCPPELLIHTIEKIILSRSLIESESVVKIVNSIEDLPSLPELFIQIENELNSGSPSINKIAQLISHDISISAKILQIANSSFYGTYGQMTDLITAVNLLGFNVIKSMILYLRFHSFITPEISKYFSVYDIWKHSNDVAVLAKNIAEKEKVNSSIVKTAYSAGLLHDIGKLIFLKHPDIVNILKKNTNISYEKEIQLLNVNHAQAGAYLLNIWNLPNSLVDAVATHHVYQEYYPQSVTSLVYYANLAINEETENISLPQTVITCKEQMLHYKI